jgi:hypothetical protein
MNSGSSETTERLLYSRKQVAQLLGGVSVATVRRHEQQGALKAIRLGRSAMSLRQYRSQT